jgi:DMSO/TMAO reductase YedYZ heme-binding membrane subunit
LAVIHFIWRVKIDVSQPVTYAVALGVLLAIRIAFWVNRRMRQAPA